MKKKLHFFVLIISMLILSSCGEKHYNEWVERNGNKYYYDEQGRMLKNGYSKIGSDTYVFNKDGSLIRDSIINLDGKTSYVDAAGKLKYNGWFSLNGHDYFVEQSALATGWKKHKGDWYYLDPSTYEMCKNQWIDNTYYVGNDGKMLVNTQKEINGTLYNFSSEGFGYVKPSCDIVFDCTFPKTFHSRNGDVIIESVAVEYDSYYRRFITHWAGTCGYPSKYYINTSCGRSVGWKLYDPDGYVIDTGTFYTDDMVYGDKFRDKKEIIGSGKLNKEGDYKVQLMNTR